MTEKENKRKELSVKMCGKRETSNVYIEKYDRLKMYTFKNICGCSINTYNNSAPFTLPSSILLALSYLFPVLIL